MPIALQAKLLHVIEAQSVRPVGGTREVAVDARIVAATNRNLAGAVKEGKFREDLLYRLDVVALALPALRDRREDLPQLAAHLIAELRGATRPRRSSGSAPRRSPSSGVTPGRGTSGSCRTCSNGSCCSGATPEIGVDDLPPAVRDPAAADPLEFRGEILPIRELQRRYAAWALTQTGGHRARAAEKLGIDVKTLRGWLE